MAAATGVVGAGVSSPTLRAAEISLARVAALDVRLVFLLLECFARALIFLTRRARDASARALQVGSLAIGHTTFFWVLMYQPGHLGFRHPQQVRDLAPAVAPPPRNCLVSDARVRASGVARPLIKDPTAVEFEGPGETVDGSIRQVKKFVMPAFL